MYDTLRTFSCIIRVFFVLLFTVHLCAIDTRFNKCNLLTYKMQQCLHDILQLYIGVLPFVARFVHLTL